MESLISTFGSEGLLGVLLVFMPIGSFNGIGIGIGRAASFFPSVLLELPSLEVVALGHGGFGINTNILETNILNLAAVVGIVVSFVGNNLNSLLEDRQKTILSNLEEANQRAIEAQQKLANAKAQLELAKKKAREIRQEGLARATGEIHTVVSQHEIRLAKLNEFQNETVQFYQQKAFKEAYLYVVSRIMTRVRARLNSGLFSTGGSVEEARDYTSHIAVNNFYVSRFTEYSPQSRI